ncbi:hypothetical protein RUM44_000101 [Polyplax serrata]|uniref:Uncharacterized protein n=1 Tax=Polyplax serrata TaxID=468196 RepID=A0ABR1B4J6_POLSC
MLRNGNSEEKKSEDTSVHSQRNESATKKEGELNGFRKSPEDSPVARHGWLHQKQELILSKSMSLEESGKKLNSLTDHVNLMKNSDPDWQKQAKINETELELMEII